MRCPNFSAPHSRKILQLTNQSKLNTCKISQYQDSDSTESFLQMDSDSNNSFDLQEQILQNQQKYVTMYQKIKAQRQILLHQLNRTKRLKKYTIHYQSKIEDLFININNCKKENCIL